MQGSRLTFFFTGSTVAPNLNHLVAVRSLEHTIRRYIPHNLCYFSLQASDRVMELDHADGRLKIHYSDRLVSLLREVRQLAALGFAIPAKIQLAANTADKFHRQAIVLKQVTFEFSFPDLIVSSSFHLDRAYLVTQLCYVA